MMAELEHYALTTTDNPYNPFTHYDEWDAFDQAAGYHTAALLARVARTSDELSDADQLVAMDEAMTEILWMNDNGLYKRIKADEVIQLSGAV